MVLAPSAKNSQRERERRGREMMLNCGAGGTSPIFIHRRPPKRTLSLCFASKVNTEQLRIQLDQLHKEAESTRAKANSARLRLMRLSEAAEKLQRQAVTSIQTGKENEARDLLFQKKKVMQALEKSKSRIELLDELSAKLNEAVSYKETELIGNVALDLDVHGQSDSTHVRIVSPKEEVRENSDANEKLEPSAEKFDNFQDLQVQAESQMDLGSDSDLKNDEISLTGGVWNEADTLSSLKEISSYMDFLKHIDQQLYEIEAELVIVLRISTLVLEGEEKPRNSKVHQLMEILEDIRRTRGRIATIMQAEVGVI